MNASGEPTSGRGAPALTAMPMPHLARTTGLPATIGGGEGAAPLERDAQHVEVVRAHGLGVGLGALPAAGRVEDCLALVRHAVEPNEPVRRGRICA